MEAFAFYLLKSVIWLAGFALVYILFLRNERFFLLNRIFLLAGILTSFFFPLISIHYTIVLPVVSSLQTDNAVVSKIQDAGNGIIPALRLMLLILYISGVFFVFTLIIRQGRSVLRSIKRSEVITLHPVKLIRTPDYTSAFSFFSYVFVNPSITDVETKEIMNHELVHIRQKHWFDLVLVQMLCMMQWFNPLVWIYVRFIRQNHEYLADEVALQRTSDPAIYRAALLNQIVGSPVVNLANSFNYSLNKKRFKMMKNIISSPYRKMKILLILPVFAIVLYAFAKPDYKYKYADDSQSIITAGTSSQQKEVKGIVLQQDGKPLDGAILTLRGTTIGTITDAKGRFTFGNVPDDGLLVVSYVGFKSKVMKPVFTSEMIIDMIRDTIKYSNVNIDTPPPPPPPPPPSESGKTKLNTDIPPIPPPPPLGSLINGDGSQPLFVIDGVTMTMAEANKINPNSIESITVLKNKSATDKYGEKGKNGIIEVKSKKKAPPPPVEAIPEEKVKEATKVAKEIPVTSEIQKVDETVIVEELPSFKGGGKAMQAWISDNLKYPLEAVNKKITGQVSVIFHVTATGKIKDVKVRKSVHPLLDAEAIRVVSSMPDWKPGIQAGKPVDVQMQVPVDFKLK